MYPAHVIGQRLYALYVSVESTFVRMRLPHTVTFSGLGAENKFSYLLTYHLIQTRPFLAPKYTARRNLQHTFNWTTHKAA